MHPDSSETSTRTSTGPRRTNMGRGRWYVAAAGLIAIVAASCAPVAEDPTAREPAAVRGPGDPAPPNTAPAGTYVTAGERLGVGGCPLFPANNVFHADISTLAVTPDSAATIAASGPSMSLRPTARALIWEGSRSGMPVNVVDSRETPLVNVIGGTYSYMSDLKGHPIPRAPRLEGYPGLAWDRHMLIVDKATCISHEFFYVTPPFAPFTTQWAAESAVKIDLRSNAARRGGSAIASGGSLLARMLRYDEVASGRVDHVLAVALGAISNQPPVWPAVGSDGRSSAPNLPRMGAWLRLRHDANLSDLGPDALVIAKALQQHGAVLGDTTDANSFTLEGENDSRWNDADIQTLRNLQLSDFEIVDPTPMKVANDSYEIR